ncbi:MAG: hypothetical protein HY788_04000 [Deltaproteobacteria bacterium]|nr:hypothetical protein [Deltaproteobacteria bacterium]
MAQVRTMTAKATSKAVSRTSPDMGAFPLPIRYKKDRDFTFWVGDVETITEDSFRISMPVELFLDDRIRFEIFDGGSRISGLADVVGVGKGNTDATCRIVAQEKRSPR